MKRIIMAAIALCMALSTGTGAQAYNLYFGGTHSHTSFSDGTAFAPDAYDSARYKGLMDFWFITEHYQNLNMMGTLTSGQKVDKWKYQNEVAKEKTENGKFIALVGWEWSDGLKAHMNVLFDPTKPPDLLMTGSFDRFNSFWIRKHPKMLTGVDHPFWSLDNKMTNLDGFKYVPEIASQTVYVELQQWEDIPFYYVALDRGWRVAPLSAQDNHGPDWGIPQESVGVYAKELTYEGLREAFIARRFYATNDRKLRLNLEGNGQPMGSKVTGDSVRLKVTVEREGDAPAYVRIISNGGGVVKEWKPTAGKFDSEFIVPVTFEDTRWYVAYAAMPNDKFSISAPIWVSKK